MTRKLETGTEKKWTVEGMNMSPSDEIYKKLCKAVKENMLEQSYLQKITGHLAPIIVDEKAREISFKPF